MPCKICGNQKTVRSHVIPKAFAHDVRDGEKHVIGVSRHRIGGKPSQGGIFSDRLLCSDHEAKTSAADTYAIEFVRRIANTWSGARDTTTLEVQNPYPDLIRRFAITTIWREVHADPLGEIGLGPYENDVLDYIFHNAVAPDWPVIVQRTNFFVRLNNPIDFNLHPYRVKFADRNGWALTVAGAAFFVISDRRGLAKRFSSGRADICDPALVTVSEQLPFTEVGALKNILTSAMRAVG